MKTQNFAPMRYPVI